MATYSLSPLFNGWQGFNAAGEPLNLGTISVYLAGTNTPTSTWTTSTAGTANSNPITLNNGFPPEQIWLQDGVPVKFVVKDAAGVTLSTDDNIASMNADSNTLRSDLASSTTTAQGAGMVGYNYALTYPSGTVGYALKNYRLKVDFGAVGNGIADDTAKLVSAIASMPDGGTLVLDGLFRITSTVYWNRRVSPWCLGADCGIVVDVGTGTDHNGIVFYGTDPTLLYGLNGLNMQLNVYGAANCCEHAVVLARVDRSNIRLNIRAGATAYGLRVRGCLINTINLQSSSNYAPPIASPGMQHHHVVADNIGTPLIVKGAASIAAGTPAVCTFNNHGFSANQCVIFTGAASPVVTQKPYFVLAAGLTANTFEFSDVQGSTPVNASSTGAVVLATATAVASNTNDFYLNLEGGVDGFVQTSQPGEGTNSVVGEIEGLTGSPFYVGQATGFTVYSMRMEANDLTSTFTGVENLHIGPGVVNYGAGPGLITLVTCKGYVVDGYFGAIETDISCTAGTFGQVTAPTITSHTIVDQNAIQISPFTIAKDPLGSVIDQIIVTGNGSATMQCVFVNPYTDLYGANDPTVGPPLGFTLYGAGGAAKKSGTVIYPGNQYVYSVDATASNTATYENGVSITNASLSPSGIDQVLSFFIPTWSVNAHALCDLYVLIAGGTLYKISETPVAKLATWVEHRGGFRVAAGQTWKIYVALRDNSTGTYVNTAGWQYFIGGVNIVISSIPPKSIDNSTGRISHVCPTVAYPPPYVGCKAYVTGTGKWYLAKDTTVNTDWIILN